MSCFITFDISDNNRYEDLKAVFELIKKAKNTAQPQTDEFWLQNFPDYVLKQFYFLETDCKPAFPTAANSEHTWHFYSLIELLQLNYEIEYLDCHKTSSTQGQLDYDPYSYPYGGITGLVVFINSFGCKPTLIDDGTSLYQIDFLDNSDFSITDLNDPKKQNSSQKRFDAVALLQKFVNRYK